MPMTRSRACDPCAARKIRCDRGAPCRRCSALGFSCTTSRIQSKPGPKGPWAEKRRLTRLQKALHGGSSATQSVGSIDIEEEEQPPLPASPAAGAFTANVPLSLLRHYLDIYYEKLYPVWPVVDRHEMVTRLENADDMEAYALCTALSAVTIAQIQLTPTEEAMERPILDDRRMAAESERARAALRYQDTPTLDLLLSSFFLHVSCANHGQVCKATVLLREAATFAQFLELDQEKHYLNLSQGEAQLHLRVIWILFVTERGHTTRFDLPRILRLDPKLPRLETAEVPSGLAAFTDLCQLFRTFGQAMDSDTSDRTTDFFSNMDLRLRKLRQLQSKGHLQQADFLITQQWMRMVLWKMSMFHIKLTADDNDKNLSISFPEHVARNVIGYLNLFPRNMVEAHGLGMQMKLADVAISLADVLSCIPWMSGSHQMMKVGPGDMLGHLARFLASIRGNVNPRMEVLQEKLSRHGFGGSPERPIVNHDEITRSCLLSSEEYEIKEDGSAVK